jgi:hypothetical protein
MEYCAAQNQAPPYQAVCRRGCEFRKSLPHDTMATDEIVVQAIDSLASSRFPHFDEKIAIRAGVLCLDAGIALNMPKIVSRNTMQPSAEYL